VSIPDPAICDSRHSAGVARSERSSREFHFVTRPAGGSNEAWPATFRALWLGQTVSSVGSQVSFVAIPLIAALLLHAGPLEMAILGGLETAPFVLLSLPSGVIADRTDRRRLLVVCDIGRAVAMASVPIAFAMGYGSFAWLCVAATLVGGLSALFNVALQAYVPEIVASRQLVRANQRLEISDAGARVAGPGLSSVLFQVGGGLLAVAVDAVTYLVSAAALLAAPASARAKRGARATESTGSAIAGGLRFVWRDAPLRQLMISTAVFNLASGMVLAQLVLLATGDLGVDAAGFGLVMGIGNIGFLVGAALVVRLEARLGTTVVLVVAAALGSAAVWIIALAGLVGGFWMLVAGRLVGAFAAPTFNVMLITVRQARSPEDMRARVAAIFRTVDWGTAPLGALLSGVIGVALGVPAVMLCAAIIGTVSLVALVRPTMIDARLESSSDGSAYAVGRLGLEVR
jgi:MFS family permease